MHSAPEGNQNSVLIVDDNEDNLQLLQAILFTSGFYVLKAGSVAEAKKLLSYKPASVDLVLSDISMPDETGFDLLTWIRTPENRMDHIPVLLITAALPEESNRIKGLSLGAVDYIVRPISNQELVLRVRNALDHYKQFRSLQRSLETSEDMANTGRILAAANHEIRNLVGLIQISAEQAIYCAERGETMTPGTHGFQCLSALSKMTRLLTQVSKDLNAHINAERIRTSICQVRVLIDDVLTLTSQKLTGVKIDASDITEKYYVMADATRAKQILVNFILNALDAIQEKGPIINGRIELKVTQGSQSSLQIRLRDNGIGLVNETRRTEFKPFETTKAVRGGKGLGLWLCSRLANAMDGKIFLESKGPGSGATAVLELKRSQPPQNDDFDIQDYFIG